MSDTSSRQGVCSNALPLFPDNKIRRLFWTREGIGPRRQSASYLSRGFFLCDDPFQPRYVLEQALAGQHEEVVAELRVLKINLEQLFIRDCHDLRVFNAFDSRSPPLIWRKEAKFAHETSRRNFHVDFLD